MPTSICAALQSTGPILGPRRDGTGFMNPRVAGSERYTVCARTAVQRIIEISRYKANKESGVRSNINSIFRFSGWRCRRPGLQENETKTRLPPKGDPEHSIAARRLHPHNVLHPIFVCGDNAARPISSQKEAVSGKMANSKIAELYKHHCPLVNPEKDRTIELLACGLPVGQSFRPPRSVR